MRSMYLPSRTATRRLPSVVEIVARCMSFLCGLSPGCGRTRWYIGERTGERGRQCTVGWPDRAERPVGSRSDKILRHSGSLDVFAGQLSPLTLQQPCKAATMNQTLNFGFPHRVPSSHAGAVYADDGHSHRFSCLVDDRICPRGVTDILARDASGAGRKGEGKIR